jgi:hypothetical protein
MIWSVITMNPTQKEMERMIWSQWIPAKEEGSIGNLKQLIIIMIILWNPFILAWEYFDWSYTDKILPMPFPIAIAIAAGMRFESSVTEVCSTRQAILSIWDRTERWEKLKGRGNQ